jgi:hypothetical protein
MKTSYNGLEQIDGMPMSKKFYSSRFPVPSLFAGPDVPHGINDTSASRGSNCHGSNLEVNAALISSMEIVHKPRGIFSRCGICSLVLLSLPTFEPLEPLIETSK